VECVRSAQPPRGRTEAAERAEKRVLRVRISLAPPFGLLLPRLSARTRTRSEKTPRFRGVLEKVAPRYRIGDAGFAASIARQQAFISVGNFGGSDSLHIRANARGLAERAVC
jgi:hypothetical protein